MGKPRQNGKRGIPLSEEIETGDRQKGKGVNEGGFKRGGNPIKKGGWGGGTRRLVAGRIKWPTKSLTRVLRDRFWK